jgi:GrpB-like predicted nucleotidyltransferase (UPF0157 family)
LVARLCAFDDVIALSLDERMSLGQGEEGGVERYGGGKIVIHEYDPAWPFRFEEERARILEALGASVLSIEHVGSTSVPGLAAKPIIDLLVGVRRLGEARAIGVHRMQALGYTHLPQYEVWLPQELLFRKGPPGPWTHHAHVMEASNPRREEYILFRDYLRQHPLVAEDYANLKKALALVFGSDIAGFRDAKRPFVEAVLASARAEAAAAIVQEPQTSSENPADPREGVGRYRAC